MTGTSPRTPSTARSVSIAISDCRPGTFETTDDRVDRIHPDDLPVFRAAYCAHFKDLTPRFECDYRFFGYCNIGAQPPGATSTGTNGPSGTAGSSGLRLLARSMSILASSSSSRRRLTSALHERSTFWT